MVFSVCWARETTFPYLSEDLWYFFADWKLSTREVFAPEKVQCGDIVLIEDCDSYLWRSLALFEEDYLPKIPHPFILMTPRTDVSLPGPFAHLLENDKIAAWFVQNIDRPPTDKLRPIPIGLASKAWRDPALLGQMKGVKKRDIFVYANFAVNNSERKKCVKICNKLRQVTSYTKPVPYDTYVEHLSRSVFVLSPPGNGEDCHRTWEALIMGCYPIVKSSSLNPLYEGLPVVIVDDWNCLTPQFLHNKQKEFDLLSWSQDTLYAPYWFAKIRALQTSLRGQKS